MNLAEHSIQELRSMIYWRRTKIEEHKKDVDFLTKGTFEELEKEATKMEAEIKRRKEQ